MIEELQRIKPRARADVEVRLQRVTQGSTLVVRHAGGGSLPLTAIGYFAFLQMDGETRLVEIQERIEQRFEGAGVDVHHLCSLIEQLQAKGLLFEDGRAVRAREALEQVGISARREDSTPPTQSRQNRHNDDVSALVHAGFAALVGSEFTRAVVKFTEASEAMPRSMRLARLVDILERISKGDQHIADDPWVGIERMVAQAIEQRVCPACGGQLRQTAPQVYACEDCSGEFHNE